MKEIIKQNKYTAGLAIAILLVMVSAPFIILSSKKSDCTAPEFFLKGQMQNSNYTYLRNDDLKTFVSDSGIEVDDNDAALVISKKVGWEKNVRVILFKDGCLVKSGVIPSQLWNGWTKSPKG